MILCQDGAGSLGGLVFHVQTPHHPVFLCPPSSYLEMWFPNGLRLVPAQKGSLDA